MANVSAASRTGYLLAQFEPNLIVFVGTAGSLRPDECKLFDVVVPTLGVVAKFYDKIEDSGGSRFKTGKLPESLADLAAFTKDRQKYKLRKNNRNIPLAGHGGTFVSHALANPKAGQTLAGDLISHSSNSGSSKVHIDASIFSWDMVLSSEHYRKLLSRQIGNKALAVDMESYGFLSAIAQFQLPPVNKPISPLIVRGISDVCGDKSTSQEEGRNANATQNAANVAFRIIRDGYLPL